MPFDNKGKILMEISLWKYLYGNIRMEISYENILMEIQARWYILHLLFNWSFKLPYVTIYMYFHTKPTEILTQERKSGERASILYMYCSFYKAA
jgi:hypothetical protein